MIPCIENKCILLPVCKHKDYITCDQLQSYFIKLMGVHKFHFNESFDKLTEILPCLYKMEGNGKVFFKYIEYDQFETKYSLRNRNK